MVHCNLPAAAAQPYFGAHSLNGAHISGATGEADI